MKWEPIETAPTDKEFLAWSEKYKQPFTVFLERKGTNRVVDGVRGASWTAKYWTPFEKPKELDTPETDNGAGS